MLLCLMVCSLWVCSRVFLLDVLRVGLFEGVFLVGVFEGVFS